MSPASTPAPTRGRTIVRWAARLAMGVTGLVVLAAGTGYALSERRVRARHDVPAHALTIPTDSATVQRGRHLARVRGCQDCHGPDLAGRTIIDDPAIGRLAGANLTAGRAGGALSDAEWERAVRHGVRADGTPLLFMPANEFADFSDEDVAAIAAYARSLPAVTRAPVPIRVGPVGRALFLAGQLSLVPAERVKHDRAHTPHVDVEPTARYGAYLAAGCVGCHGAELAGGHIPGTPPDWKPAANITPTGIGSWTEADFIRAMRTGVRPNGTPIDSLMPWRAMSAMHDVELQALYAYLRTVPARPTGR